MKKAKAMITAEAANAIVKSIDLGKGLKSEYFLERDTATSVAHWLQFEIQWLGLPVVFKKEIIEQEKAELFEDDEKSEYICPDPNCRIETKAYSVYDTPDNPGEWSTRRTRAVWHINRSKSTDEWIVVMDYVAVYEQVKEYRTECDNLFSLLGVDEGAYQLVWKCVECCDSVPTVIE